MTIIIETEKNIVNVKVEEINDWIKLIKILDELYKKNIRLIFNNCLELQEDYNLLNIISKYNIFSLDIIDTQLISNTNVILNILNLNNNTIKEYYFLNNNFNDIDYLRNKLKEKKVTYHLEQEEDYNQKKYVYNVYDNIWKQFDDSRFSVWNFVKKFLQDKKHMKGIDIGCGNGKNMNFINNINFYGIDNCKALVNVCKNKNLHVTIANCLDIPYKDNSFDFSMSIAVFHHLMSDIKRINAVKEMIRVTKRDGECIFSVWSLENQNKENKVRKFKTGDNYVDWIRKKDKEIFKRYYYIYSEKMIKDFMNIFKNNIKDLKIFNERGNWVVNFFKL